MKNLSLSFIILFAAIQYLEAVPVFQETDEIIPIEMESSFGQNLGEWVVGTSVDPGNQTGSRYYSRQHLQFVKEPDHEQI